MASLPVIGCLIGGYLAFWWFTATRAARKEKENPQGLPLPPGPKTYPLIENLLNLPFHKPWLVYAKWFKIYGNMIYLKLLGRDLLILSNLEIVNEVLEKRSHNYSDRPPLPMINDLMGWDFAVGTMPYGSLWRQHRRIIHDHFNAGIINKYQPIQISVARNFLRNLLESPSDDSDFSEYIRWVFAAVMMKIVYSIDIKDKDDLYITNAQIALKGLGEAATPCRFLVDIFPSMKWIPAWIPGAGWKRKARYWANLNAKITHEPFQLVKKQMNEGTANPSICSQLIEELPEESSSDRAEAENVARDVCAAIFLGGADTTVSIILSFFLAMCIYPDVQSKAQAELDAVLHGRLPEFSDYLVLPYIQAIVKETLRWNPVSPLVYGHLAIKADEYNGYHIPKGTSVLVSALEILHDPEVFEKPTEYIPERFLKEDGTIDPTVRDPSVAAFGFGRRICPGRFFSEEALFVVIVHVLAVFDVKPGVGEGGAEVVVRPDYVTTGVLQYPAPFSCRIVPRSVQAEELIINSEVVG